MLPLINHFNLIISWPVGGAVGFITAGRNTFDLYEGTFTAADDTEEPLSNAVGENEFQQSVHLHPYFSFGMAVVVEGPKGLGGPRTAQFWLDRQHHYLHHIACQKLHIIATLPGALFIEFGREHEVPVTPEGFFSPDIFAGEITTTDTMTAVVMRPVAPNAVTGVPTIMSIARAQSGSPTMNAQVIQTIFSRHQTWIVRNTGANAADINLQGSMRAVDAFFANDPATGAVLVLPAGDTALLQATRTYIFTRLRARSTVAGASTTLTIDTALIGGI